MKNKQISKANSQIKGPSGEDWTGSSSMGLLPEDHPFSFSAVTGSGLGTPGCLKHSRKRLFF